MHQDSTTASTGSCSCTSKNTVHLKSTTVIEIRCLLARQKNIQHRKTGELYLPWKVTGSLSQVHLVPFCNSTFSPLHITPLMLHHPNTASQKITAMSPVLQKK